MLNLKLQYFGHLMRRADSLEKTLMLGGLGAGGEGDNRGQGDCMASPTRWAWVWVNSGSWWWTGRPGVLWLMGSQEVGHDWVTELNWTDEYPFNGTCEKKNNKLYADVIPNWRLMWTGRPCPIQGWGGWRHGPHLYTSSRVTRLSMLVGGEDAEWREGNSGRHGARLAQVMRREHRCGCREGWRASVTVPTRRRRLGTNGGEATTLRRLQPGWDDEEHRRAFT